MHNKTCLIYSIIYPVLTGTKHPHVKIPLLIRQNIVSMHLPMIQ